MFAARVVLVGVIGFSLMSFALGQTTAPVAAPAVAPSPVTALAPPILAGKSWILLDMSSNQVLVGQDPDARVEPASLTKLMTAYLSFAALRDKKLTMASRPTVSKAAYEAIGSRMFVDPKTPATVEELLSGMIVQSGNDAAIILAEAIAGSEAAFAQVMNREAARLGMKNSSFTNSTGLPDPNHFSTARDLATLAARLISDFPDNYSLYSKKSYTYNNIIQENRNRLLFVDPSVDGVKTGFTDAAGYCLIASAKKDQPGVGSRRLLSVVLGTNSMAARATESQKLLAWGFQNFDLAQFYKANQAIATYEVWKGKAKQIGAGVEGGLNLTIPKGQVDAIKADIERMQPLVAPIAKGQKIGTVKVKLGDKVIAERALVANEAVEEAGFIGRMIDTIRLWLK